MYFCVVLYIDCFVTFSVLFVCICVLNNCHWVATQLQLNISYHIIKTVGWESSVGIATRYRLDGPGIKTPRRQDFSAPVQTSPGAHPASSTMGTESFLRIKRLGHGLENPPSSDEDVKKRVQT
jgi:hypothetical protein